jgi:crossover junction endodeoxyribonuclease RusA
MTTVNLILPWPPTLNNLYPSGNSGRRFLSPKGKAYVIAFHSACLKQLGLRKPLLSGRIAYRMRFLVPDRRRRDLPNCLKAVEDCLTKSGIWLDDSQVDDGHFTRGPVVKGGLVEVEIWQITPVESSTQPPETGKR